MKTPEENLFTKNTIVMRTNDALHLALLALDDPEENTFYEESAEAVFHEKFLSNIFTRKQEQEIRFFFNRLLEENDDRAVKITGFLGMMLLYTSHSDRNIPTGLQLLENAAQLGDRMARFNLGNAWLLGMAGEEWTPESRSICITYFEKSLWHPFSSAALGDICKNKMQFDQAIIHYQRVFQVQKPFKFGTTLAHHKAWYDMGTMYYPGTTTAIDYFQKSVSSNPGFYLASWALACAHERNHGDANIILDNLELAAEQGFFRACKSLAEKYFGQHANIQNTKKRINNLLAKESPLGWFCQGFMHEKAHKLLEALVCYRKASFLSMDNPKFNILDVRAWFIQLSYPHYQSPVSQSTYFFTNMFAECWIFREFVQQIQEARSFKPKKQHDKKFAALLDAANCKDLSESLWSQFCSYMMQTTNHGESILWMLRLPLSSWPDNFDMTKLDNFPFRFCLENTTSRFPVLYKSHLETFKFWFAELKNPNSPEEKLVIEKFLRLYANQIEQNIRPTLMLNRCLLFSQTSLIRDVQIHIASYLFELDEVEARGELEQTLSIR